MENVESEKSKKFVWKRNIKYDLTLLQEANLKNPFAFNNEKPAWMDVAKSLQEGDLKMKVTDRSCRERVTELLKNHRKNELTSIRTSGISEEEMSELRVLLSKVDILESTKPNKQLKSLYTTKDRDDAEAIRSKALQEALNGDNPFLKAADEELEKTLVEEENRKRKAETTKEKGNDEVSDRDFEFGPSKVGKFEGPSNPKNKLKDILLQKEELLVREKEVENKKKEVENQMKEVENKAKELDIMRMKAEAEIDERKKITDLLLKLATPGE